MSERDNWDRMFHTTTHGEPEMPIEPAPTPRRRGWILVGIAVTTLAVTVPLTILAVGDDNPSPVALPPAAKSSPVTDAAPLDVSVTPFTVCSRNILVDQVPDEVAAPVDVQDTPAWVTAMDGVVTGYHDLAVTVQGVDDRTVVIQALHVRRIKALDPPTTGNVYVLGDGCGGAVDTSTFTVNLDKLHPVPSSPETQALPLKTSEDDPVVLQVAAQATSRGVTWYLKIDWASGSEHGTLKIDDNGNPFRTTGAADRPMYYYDPGGRGWVAG
ncbi:hypothetical protein [Kineosporia sp. NBRC 101731]|uniref:hypothetical protein n=1 Tax=Kineosporia sp. NBRC 101731 TaxID=3032199 RepID=UPI0024A5DF0D|nr:hypothetical protein [Kineosporia sp. NBRC 101731]GLY29088.1 hypothetical protein Kisp02_24530 [Kineosporia sp. NBRC 101731]